MSVDEINAAVSYLEVVGSILLPDAPFDDFVMSLSHYWASPIVRS